MTVQEWLGADNKLGIDIWERKYRYNNESFDEWLDRVSAGNNDIKQLIIEKKFLFGGRILASRGLQKINPDVKVTYSNCYVLGAPEDNLESIFECASKLARTYSYGGGVGIDLSKLAPVGAKVRNAAKHSSGAVSFMDLYSMVTGLISQNGRRGALMLSMACDHPDIEEFIDIKKDLNRVTKANISVRVTDEFMQAVIDNKEFELKFTRKETGEVISKTVNAKDLMMKLAYNNWDMGEPGILFWDRIENWNLLSEYENFQYAGTNPCAEEPLPSGGSCLLGSINLAEFASSNGFDYAGFRSAVMIATKALNDVLDEGLELHPLQEQRDSVRDWRQIGLGIFGLADALIKMGVRYGSDDAIEICDFIGYEMINSAMDASNSYDNPFVNHDPLKTCKSIFFNKNYAGMFDEIKLHNSQLLTIAPTGTLSTMLGVSGGIEPIFAYSYSRKTESLHDKEKVYDQSPTIVKEYMKKHDLNDFDLLPDYFVTAKDLDYHERIKMQSVWQNHIDASISSTVNLPYDATPEDVFNLYVEAWKAGLKGITVFRDGCRRASILSTEPQKKPEPEKSVKSPVNDVEISFAQLARGYVLDTNDQVVGKKRRLTTGCGSLHCTAFFDPITGDLMETYLSKGSTGGCQNFMIGLSRMISLAARSGCDIHSIIDQLNSCGVCPSYAVRRATKHDTSKGSCCPIAVGNALLDMWKEMQDEILQGDIKEDNELEDINPDPDKSNNTPLMAVHKIECPECGETIVHEGGCDICKNCGYSKCS